jgi:hypothetical protein
MPNQRLFLQISNQVRKSITPYIFMECQCQVFTKSASANNNITKSPGRREEMQGATIFKTTDWCIAKDPRLKQNSRLQNQRSFSMRLESLHDLKFSYDCANDVYKVMTREGAPSA